MPKNEKDEQSLVPSNSNLPDFLRAKGKSRGHENIDKSDLVLPRIKLLQPLSPEIDKGFTAGDLINSLTGESYGKKMTIIPIIHFKSRIYWKEREEGGGMLCSAHDALHPSRTEFAPNCSMCTLKDWNNSAKTAKDKAPKCVIYYNFAVLINNSPMPVALSMERTKIRIAKKLLSLAAYSGGQLDMFARKYEVITEKVKNEQGTWYNYNISPAGFVSEEEFQRAEAVYESLKDLALSVEQENSEE